MLMFPDPQLDRYRRPSAAREPTSPRSPVSPPSEYTSANKRMSDIEDAGSSSTPVDQQTERGRPKLRTKTLDGSLAPGNDEHRREEDRDDQDVSMERRPYVGSDRSVPQWIQGASNRSRLGECHVYIVFSHTFLYAHFWFWHGFAKRRLQDWLAHPKPIT